MEKLREMKLRKIAPRAEGGAQALAPQNLAKRFFQKPGQSHRSLNSRSPPPQEDLKFKANLGYLARQCLKKKI
jgi:hypothetical protein